MAKGNIVLDIDTNYKGEGMTKLNQSIKGAAQSTRQASKSISGVVQALGGVEGKVGKIFTGVNGIMGAFAQGGVFGLAAAGIGMAFKFVMDKIEEAKKKAEEAAKKMKESFENMFKGLGTSISGMREAAATRVGNINYDTGRAVSGVSKETKAAIAKLQSEGLDRRSQMLDEDEKALDLAKEELEVQKLIQKSLKEQNDLKVRGAQRTYNTKQDAYAANATKFNAAIDAYNAKIAPIDAQVDELQAEIEKAKKYNAEGHKKWVTATTSAGAYTYEVDDTIDIKPLEKKIEALSKQREELYSIKEEAIKGIDLQKEQDGVKKALDAIEDALADRKLLEVESRTALKKAEQKLKEATEDVTRKREEKAKQLAAELQEATALQAEKDAKYSRTQPQQEVKAEPKVEVEPQVDVKKIEPISVKPEFDLKNAEAIKVKPEFDAKKPDPIKVKPEYDVRKADSIKVKPEFDVQKADSINVTPEFDIKKADPIKVNPEFDVQKADSITVTPQFDVKKIAPIAIDPQLDVKQPKAVVIEPDVDIKQPKTQKVEPKLDVTQPEAEVEPLLTVKQPKATTVEPDIKVAKPKSQTVEPKFKTKQPKPVEVKPQLKVKQPKTQVVEPSVVVKPKVKVAEAAQRDNLSREIAKAERNLREQQAAQRAAFQKFSEASKKAIKAATDPKIGKAAKERAEADMQKAKKAWKDFDRPIEKLQNELAGLQKKKQKADADTKIAKVQEDGIVAQKELNEKLVKAKQSVQDWIANINANKNTSFADFNKAANEAKKQVQLGVDEDGNAITISKKQQNQVKSNKQILDRLLKNRHRTKGQEEELARRQAFDDMFNPEKLKQRREAAQKIELAKAAAEQKMQNDIHQLKLLLVDNNGVAL